MRNLFAIANFVTKKLHDWLYQMVYGSDDMFNRFITDSPRVAYRRIDIITVTYTTRMKWDFSPWYYTWIIQQLGHKGMRKFSICANRDCHARLPLCCPTLFFSHECRRVIDIRPKAYNTSPHYIIGHQGTARGDCWLSAMQSGVLHYNNTSTL